MSELRIWPAHKAIPKPPTDMGECLHRLSTGLSTRALESAATGATLSRAPAKIQRCNYAGPGPFHGPQGLQPPTEGARA
jgi:hypothetical protein